MGKFLELSRCKIGSAEENKNLVVSVNDEGKLSIAQQIVVDNDGKPMGIFLKNSIVVEPDKIPSIIDALQKSLVALEKKPKKPQKT